MNVWQRMRNNLIKLMNITFFKIILFILLGVILFFTLYGNVKPEKLNVQLFSVADQTIRSPITVEDKESTEKKKEEAKNQVQDVYVVNKEIAQNRVDLISSIFDSVTEVNNEVEKQMEEKRKKAEEEDKNKQSIKEPSVDEKLELLKGKLTNEVTNEIMDRSLKSLIPYSEDQLEIAKDITVTAIHTVMNGKIPSDEVENAKKRVEDILKVNDGLTSDLKSASIDLGRFAIIQNEFYDPTATEEMRQQAVDGVEPIRVLQGQVLVEEGQLISREIHRQLELVGLLDSDNSIQPFIGLGLIILTMLAALYFYTLKRTSKEKENNIQFYLMFFLIISVTIVLMKTISAFQQFEYTEIGYIFPAAMAVMLIKILMEEKSALLVTIILAVCGMIMFNEGVAGTFNVGMGIYIIASGLASILFLYKRNQRTNILYAGFFISFINIVTILAILYLQNGHYGAKEYGVFLLLAVISGISSAVLTIGFLPFLETGFGVLSTIKLIELSNPNHPLLRKILTEAPGTYHHSVMVANLAESACEAIGANGLLARVGCYYHDIGKTKRPHFFIENQMNMGNPHDRIPPQASKNIIIAHATDGAELLRKYKLPKEIVDIAEQHHGTSLLKYFYFKAKEKGGEVKESDYRYPGPKAQTREVAIIGIADSVEAAVRSLNAPTTEQIDSLIKNIISDRLQDGQLDECDLTLKELDIVRNTLSETLKGIFHSRIEYPEMKK
ncbi:HDIG domain-containing protein [Niallia circulans]|jgi:cyclic-di-AMP phosphodiesterase PgpH|uniref:Membrane protein n=1 Tax=Niallia circulans TaxID=1397 RepID=A0A0J1LEG7_NIACI|nr:HD family phosphohydrolase [Niallia circulans]KLV27315.1 membrane protein [Niallia circulans]MDR4314344.1 HD family phosphohydrolase [Niallia circulans]MED3839428.1 HD family phosphohydrolase [Niallia circulans]MED4242500.1 HD family phosphohydrolase [Niallia circulans]MED4246478.1 HD family phosphohydrolase [Niallia circulans]